MLFNSYAFLLGLLPIALVGYYLLAHRVGALYAKVWLCAASFVFYGWLNPKLLLLLSGSILFNSWLSRSLTGDEETARRQNLILTAGVAANLLLLFYYKYLFPLLSFVHQMGWVEHDFGTMVLPIGISFFTFTQIGYLVDCRQGLVKERGPLHYVLFVTFFPHLVAGPILHHREVMPQFASDQTYRFKSENLATGMTVFAVGMAKKVLLADSIADCADAGFAHATSLGFLQAWSTVLAYAMQLYFDFSGYSDMAVGLGIMFGVKLPLNFNSPYKSYSIIDFWQRWHMTLTRYITLLLYNPISLAISRRRQEAGKPIGKQATATVSGFFQTVVVPTMITLLLAGIWHGAGLTYIMYGVLHGTYLCINHAWRLFYPVTTLGKLTGRAAVWGRTWRWTLTFLAVLVSLTFFRAASVPQAMEVLAGTVGLHGTGLPLPFPLSDMHLAGSLAGFLLDHHVLVLRPRAEYNAVTRALLGNWALIVGLAVIAFKAPNVYQILDRFSPALGKVQALSWRWLLWRPSVAWALVCSVLLYLSEQQFDHAARFLYFQF